MRGIAKKAASKMSPPIATSGIHLRVGAVADGCEALADEGIFDCDAAEGGGGNDENASAEADDAEGYAMPLALPLPPRRSRLMSAAF